MRRDFLVGMGLLASVAAGAGSAVAADLPVRPAAAPAMVAPPYVPDWVGFYVGINGGGGWGHTSFEPQESNTVNGLSQIFSVPPDASPKGGVFGFQFGHNWQWGPVVGGLEFDFDGASIKETSTFFPSPAVAAAIAPDTATFTREAKIDELASVRGRVGYLIFPNWLLYGTAGLGWGHFRLNTTQTTTGVGLSAFDSTTTYADQFGWVAGVGLEWKFWDHWMLRGEWLHYDFGRTSGFGPTGAFTLLDNFNERTTVDIARAALSYKF
jgi:outer membrane immunogenic protein